MPNKRKNTINIHGDESLVDGVVVMGSDKTGYVIDVNLAKGPVHDVTVLKTCKGKRSFSYSLVFRFRTSPVSLDVKSIDVVHITFSTSVDFECAKVNMDSSSYSLILAKRTERGKKVIIPGKSKRVKGSVPPFNSCYRI